MSSDIQGGRAVTGFGAQQDAETAIDCPLDQWPDVAARLEQLLREWATPRLEAVPDQYPPTVRIRDLRTEFLSYLDETGRLVWPIPSGPVFDVILGRAMRSSEIRRGGRGGGFYRGLQWRPVNAEGNIPIGDDR
jgi:hypothetical protein